MLSDGTLAFVPLGGNLSLVAGAGIAIPSTQIIDLLGQGVGTAPQGIFGTSRTTFGEDPGIGGLRPELMISIGAAVTGAAGTTMRVALQGAADQGAAGNYQPGTWTDIVDQDNIALANLTANAIPARFPWLPSMPPGLLPRYLRLLFSPQLNGTTPSGSFTAGTIASALVVTVRDDYSARYAQKNYAVQ